MIWKTEIASIRQTLDLLGALNEAGHADQADVRNAIAAIRSDAACLELLLEDRAGVPVPVVTLADLAAEAKARATTMPPATALPRRRDHLKLVKGGQA